MEKSERIPGKRSPWNACWRNPYLESIYLLTYEINNKLPINMLLWELIIVVLINGCREYFEMSKMYLFKQRENIFMLVYT